MFHQSPKQQPNATFTRKCHLPRNPVSMAGTYILALFTLHGSVTLCFKPCCYLSAHSNATDKPTLPLKTRAMTRTGSKHPSTCTNLLGPGNEEEQVGGETRSASASGRESRRHREEKESTAVQPEFRRSSTVPPEPKHLNHNHAPAGGEQKEHALMLELLKKHRPTKSVYREQPAAERTDVLYDTVSVAALKEKYICHSFELGLQYIELCFLPGVISSTVV